MAIPAPRHRRGVLAWVIGAVVVLVVAGVVVALVTGNGNSNTTPRATISAATTATGCNVTSVAEQKLPSVVTIQAGGSGGASGGVGSGEVIRADGYILTNNHVILPAVGGGSLQVVFEDGSAAHASLVGRDPLTDLAVIRVTGKSDLKPITIGKSSTLQIGQPVVALGAPLGLSSTVTSGIVSALGRTIQVPAEESQVALLVDAIQTDAAINPGNSGGALVNCSGELVGIPTAGATSGESSGSIGLGFAIPVDSAMKVADEIISTGTVTHAFIGLSAQPLTATATGQSGTTPGLFITAVTAGGPASSAGLQTGDIIRSIDGTPAASTEQLVALTLSKRSGDQVKVTYERDGKETTTTITLGSRT
jgi:putative serine protease PepD